MPQRGALDGPPNPGHHPRHCWEVRLDTLAFEILGVRLTVACDHLELRSLLLAHYGHMRADPAGAALAYRVGPMASGRGFFFQQQGQPASTAADTADFLAAFDGDVTMALERARPDLYFLHAAAVVSDGAAVILVAPSGGGKSISTWALAHHGFAYSSDELAPIELESMAVHPYARALSLKARPPDDYPLPADAVLTSRTIHIPARVLPGGIADAPERVRTLVFLQHRPDLPDGFVRAISAAESAARLYANALNPLAHPADGLQGAVRIAASGAAYLLVTPDLQATCRLIPSALAGPRSLD